MRKAFSAEAFVERYELIGRRARILNAGSGTTRFGADCVNIDIQAKPGVDVVCDLHAPPASLGRFDAVICNAVLQYCREPRVVAANLIALLKPGGLLFVDAPWVQPYCPDTPDRFRFSQEALADLFGMLEIIESGPSLTSGVALHMQACAMAQGATANRYINAALVRVTGAVLYPLRWLSTAGEARTAGAFYLIGRRRNEA